MIELHPHVRLAWRLPDLMWSFELGSPRHRYHAAIWQLHILGPLQFGFVATARQDAQQYQNDSRSECEWPRRATMLDQHALPPCWVSFGYASDSTRVCLPRHPPLGGFPFEEDHRS